MSDLSLILVIVGAAIFGAGCEMVAFAVALREKFKRYPKAYYHWLSMCNVIAGNEDKPNE